MIAESLFYAIGASLIALTILHLISYWLAPNNLSKSEFDLKTSNGDEIANQNRLANLEQTLEWFGYFSILQILGLIFASFCVLNIINSNFKNWYVLLYLFLSLFAVVALIGIRDKPNIREN